MYYLWQCIVVCHLLLLKWSKAALATMTKNIANSVASYQIRVNALNIGWTDTPAEHDIQTRVHKKILIG